MDTQLYELLASGATLLTSSRRLAHAVRTEYATHGQARGRKVWLTPQVLPWSTFVRDTCFMQRATDSVALQLLSDAQALALWDDVVGASTAGQRLLNPAQAARAASRSWQRLYQYQIPLAHLADFPSEEAQTFAAWAQSFIERTQARDRRSGHALLV